MRSVVQRVLDAKITIDGKVHAEIGKGFLVLVGFNETDDINTIKYTLEKISNLRIFDDEDGKLNLSLKDVAGELLIVPNFTIYGDTRKGRRPSFINSAKPEVAVNLFEQMQDESKTYHDKIQFGIFQADMKVNLTNDGPITLIVEKDN